MRDSERVGVVCYCNGEIILKTFKDQKESKTLEQFSQKLQDCGKERKKGKDEKALTSCSIHHPAPLINKQIYHIDGQPDERYSLTIKFLLLSKFPFCFSDSVKVKGGKCYPSSAV